MSKHRLHLVYIPADLQEGLPDLPIKVIETDDLTDVLFEVRTNPGSISMELECQHPDELPMELTQLGF